MTDTLAALLVELRSLTDVRAIGLADAIEAELETERLRLLHLCAEEDAARWRTTEAAILKVADRFMADLEADLRRIAGGEKP